jgi:hypothetical protein
MAAPTHPGSVKNHTPSSNPRRICLAPRLTGLSGMTSFQRRLASGLQARGVEVTYDLHGGSYDALLVTGGIKDLPGLRKAKKRDIPVIQRLNGMNWLHRRLSTGLRHYLKAEYGKLYAHPHPQ